MFKLDIEGELIYRIGCFSFRTEIVFCDFR